MRTIAAFFLLLAFALQGFGQRLAAPAGEHGVWVPPNAGDERLVEPDDPADAARPFAIETNPLQRTPRVAVSDAAAPSFRKLKVSEVPFQPWSRALYAYRQQNQMEPHTRCKPSGGPRQFLTPYGVEFLEQPELQRIYIVDIGGPHTLRVVFMNGSPHPADLEPSYLGHSVGKWDNETLVIDTLGFNERFWFDRWGLPHTEQLHVTERFTRLDQNTLKYEVTIDDPGAYTAPWTTGLLLRWNPSQELFEYVCQDNNLAPQLMVGASESIERPGEIVP